MNKLGSETAIQSVQELAERILFSNSLEEKLAIVDIASVSFEDGGKPCRPTSSVLPGRPDNLNFAQSSAKKREAPPLPASAHLVSEENRGLLLHFFANHELLAAELMALALLRFPDAPTEFRQGLFQTLREEQRHTTWYIRRMKECGVSFGDYPVNGFFWDSVSTMETPLDYVSRLSLTFEQANLDYACHFSRILDTAGDPKSAAIMRQIYQDEIAHVNYGLQWFRKWKKEGESDWDCLKKTLIFPLSPSRAKGNKTEFNREGRLAAGFSREYVDRLSVFERSNGRTPNIFYFNPEAEEHIAALPGTFQPKKKLLSLIEDLEILAAFFARRDDVLLMRKPPSLEHLTKLAKVGFILPEIETLTGAGEIAEDSLLWKRRIHSLRPWSSSPDLSSQLGKLLPLCSPKETSSLWSDKNEKLFSKTEQSDFFQQWMDSSAICKTSDEINAALKLFRSRGYQRSMIKAPVSAAGKGLAIAPSGQPLFGRNLNFALQVIEKQGSVLLEPFHERIFDFSVQFSIEKDRSIQTMGMLRQLVSEKGLYHGTIAPIKFCQNLDPELAQFLMNKVLPQYESDGKFVGQLLKFAASADYIGPLGVDAYVYRDPDGQFKHRVICEMNPRYTMGRLTLELKKQISPGKNLRFEIIRANKPAAIACRTVTLDSKGKIENGQFILNQISPETQFAAKISIAKNIQSFYT